MALQAVKGFAGLYALQLVSAALQQPAIGYTGGIGGFTGPAEQAAVQMLL